MASYWLGDPEDPKLKKLIEAECTRQAIDLILTESISGPRYPDEWYADKNNRMMGNPTGHIRLENAQVVWFSYKGNK